MLATAGLLIGLALLQGARVVRIAQVGTPPASDSIRTVSEGDTLSDVVLLPFRGPAVSLSRVAGDGCRILVVFHSECVWSARLAETGVFETSFQSVNVTWISVPDDVERARDFLQTYGVGVESAYLLQRWRDVAALGIFGSPTILVVGPELEFMGEINQADPTLPQSCLE